MTWQETYELVKKVTQEKDGVQYRGLELNVIERMASALSPPYIDPKTNKALLNTDNWQKVLSFAAEVHQIPGNKEIVSYWQGDKLFLDGNLAMLTSLNDIIQYKLYTQADMWDIASYLVWPAAPGFGTRVA